VLLHVLGDEEDAVQMVGHELEGEHLHLLVVLMDGEPASLYLQAQWRRLYPGSLGAIVGCIGIAYEAAQQRASALHRHGDEINPPRLVVMPYASTEHRGLLLACEWFVFLEGFFIHCLFPVLWFGGCNSVAA